MSAIRHPKEEPVWEHPGARRLLFASGERLYAFVWQAPFGFRFSAFEQQVGVGIRKAEGPCDSIEHGKRLVEEAVAAWRAEGELV